MKITRSRTHRFNMGAYEHLEVSATVQADTEELAVTDDDEITAYMDDLLGKMLRADVERASEVTRTDEDDTYVHDWKEVL